MLNTWMLIPLIAAAMIAVLALLLWRVRGLRVSRATLLSAVAALVVFQILFFWQGASFQGQLLLALGIVLTLNAGVELAKWLMVEFALRPKHLRIPLFLVDLIGWIVLVTAALLVISHIFALDLTGLLVSSTVVSAIIALSLQQLLGSLFAGIVLQLDGPFQVDDWVQIDGQEGRVVRLNWRTLTLLTLRNECVILPNNQITQSRMINYTRPGPMVACDLLVGVARIHPPNEVKAVLREAFAGIEGLAPMQPPQVMIWEYADFSIQYGIRYWFHDYGLKLRLHDAVLTRVWYALRRAGVTMPDPIRDVNMRLVTDEHEQRLTLAHQQQIVQTLQPVVLFEGLTDAQRQQLAAGAWLQRYTEGETLVREGEAGDSLFIIKAGQVGVYVAGADGRAVLVAQRGAGEYFGEMSLLTGAPRSASVVATLETQVVIIDKQAFTTVLTADPSMLDALLDALDKRRSVVETRLAEASVKTEQTQALARATLLQRIGGFLGIKLVPLRASQA